MRNSLKPVCIFPVGLVKTRLNYCSVKTGSCKECWFLSFSDFSDLICHLEEIGIGIFFFSISRKSIEVVLEPRCIRKYVITVIFISMDITGNPMVSFVVTYEVSVMVTKITLTTKVSLTHIAHYWFYIFLTRQNVSRKVYELHKFELHSL